MSINTNERFAALDILASVVSNVQDYLPKKNLPEHRVSCHRCGNIRKRKLLCPRQTCPHIFCGRCADKMLEEHGEDVFAGGCPVCQELCCCSNKSIACNRQNHCYRKCPSTKGKNGIKNEDTPGEPEYHISAPALEILAQVVSDPFRGFNSTSTSSSTTTTTSSATATGTELKKRKYSNSSPTNGSVTNNSTTSITQTSSSESSQNSPRLDIKDEINASPASTSISDQQGEKEMASSSTTATTTIKATSPTTLSSKNNFSFNHPGHSNLHASMGLTGSKEYQALKSPKSNYYSDSISSAQPYSQDAASLSANYAISSLFALSAAAGNYDYSVNAKPRSHQENNNYASISSTKATAVNSPSSSSSPLSSKMSPSSPTSTSTSKPVNSNAGLPSPSRPHPNANANIYANANPNAQYKTGISAVSQNTPQKLAPTSTSTTTSSTTSTSSPFVNGPQYMATAAALSDSSFESYIPALPRPKSDVTVNTQQKHP